MIQPIDKDSVIGARPGEGAETILAALPDALLRVRNDGTILDYKPSSMNLLRVDRGELVGLHVLELARMTDLFDEATLSLALRHVQLAIEQDKPQCLEVQLAAGAWPLWLEIRAFKLAADEGVVVIREISAERRQRATRQHELADTRALVAELLGERDEQRERLISALARIAEELPSTAAARLQQIRSELLPEQHIAPEELEPRIEQLLGQACGKAAIAGCARVELCPAALTPEIASRTFAVLHEAFVCVEQERCAERVRVSLVNTAEKLSLTFAEGVDAKGGDAEGASPVSAATRSATMARIRYHVERMGGSLRVTPGRHGTAISIQVELSKDG